MEAKAPLSDARSASKFVTVLGWLSVVLGASSAVGAVVVVTALLAPDGWLATVLGPIDHRVGNGLFWEFLDSIVLLATGVGLVHRKRWALRTGTAVLLFAILRTAFGVANSLLELNPFHPPLGSALFGFVFCIIWTGYLFWFFRRPSIRAEFEPMPVAPSP